MKCSKITNFVKKLKCFLAVSKVAPNHSRSNFFGGYMNIFFVSRLIQLLFCINATYIFTLNICTNKKNPSTITGVMISQSLKIQKKCLKKPPTTVYANRDDLHYRCVSLEHFHQLPVVPTNSTRNSSRDSINNSFRCSTTH